MSRIAIDLNYFPNLEFFTAISGFDTLVLFPDQRFQRRTYINRTDILGPNKVQRLTVPIQGRRPAIPVSQLKIDYEQKWLQSHSKSIQTAYGKAPFYEFYFPYFEQVFAAKPQFLYELNEQILTLCLRLLGSSAKIEKAYSEENKDDFLDIRGLISPEGHFSDRGIYQSAPYFQLFGVDFEPNMSILDLLFNEGPEASRIILKSLKKD